jgi:hypothetical protein
VISGAAIIQRIALTAGLSLVAAGALCLSSSVQAAAISLTIPAPRLLSPAGGGGLGGTGINPNKLLGNPPQLNPPPLNPPPLNPPPANPGPANPPQNSQPPATQPPAAPSQGSTDPTTTTATNPTAATDPGAAGQAAGPVTADEAAPMLVGNAVDDLPNTFVPGLPLAGVGRQLHELFNLAGAVLLVLGAGLLAIAWRLSKRH